jgi:FlaG/FlaF family flagellin (archaellin)
MVTSGGCRAAADERGLSNILGYTLVLAIVLGGTVVVLVMGTGALDASQGQSEIQRAEHSMTLLDSRTALVALGTSSSQTIPFGQDSGEFEVENDTGYIALYHKYVSSFPQFLQCRR